MPQLCRACQSLCSTAESIESLFSPDGYVAHETVATLQKNATAGCPFCSLMVDPRYASNIDWAFVLEERNSFQVRLKGTRNENGILEYILVQCSIGYGRAYWSEYMSFKVHIHEDTSTESQLRLRNNFNTPSAMSALKDWLDGCGDHEDCTFIAMPKLPSRVLGLKVTDNDHVKLMESNGQKGEYALLSYCWGGEQATVTTKSNIAAHLDQLSMHSLSQTIQDAITVARNLNFAYLWVDALCIIQDDAEDKMLEIAKIHDYFKKGNVTIIAASAGRAQDGFLRAPQIPSCDLPYLSSDTKVITATLTYNIDDSETKYHRKIDPREKLAAKFRSPILTRAWTYEESLLSRRKLRFGFNQIEWECQDGYAAYTQESNGTGGMIVTESRGHTTSDPPEFKYFANNYEPSRHTILNSWAKAVETYTSRHLTKREDKLPAIGAIAHAFNRVRKDKYLAGIWMETLCLDLLWHMDIPSHILPTVRRLWEPTIAKAPINRAPSWSWAAMDGRVKFDRPDGVFVEEAILRAFNVQPKSPRSPFGQVRPGGYLEFDAKVKRLPALDPKEYYVHRFPCYEEADSDKAIRFDLEPQENWNGCEAWYLWLATRNYKDNWGKSPEERAVSYPVWKGPGREGSGSEPDEHVLDEAVGLIVAKTGSEYSNDFRRIGLFCGTQPVWFAQTPNSRIRLV